MFGCSNNASGTRDPELILSSVDPPGKFDGVHLGYMLDLRGTDVRGGDQKGKCGARRWHEEGPIDD